MNTQVGSGRSDLKRLSEPAGVFDDRLAAGRALASALEGERGPETVVVGLAHGGIELAAEVAGALGAPLDVVAVRKIRHPRQPEYGIGAVTPGTGVYVRGPDGLSEEELTHATAEAEEQATRLDRRLHAAHPALDLRGKTVLLVDDGLATGATMIAALRWAKAAGAARVVAAVPVAAVESLALITPEASEVVCLRAPRLFSAVGAWYREFDPVDDDVVVRRIAEHRYATKAR